MTHDAEVTDARPVFVIPVLPAEVPPALLALLGHAEVRYVDAPVAGMSGSGACKAASLVESIRQTIERQRKGRFWLHEAAQILADAHGLDAPQLLRRMKEAFRLGGLRVRDPATGTLRIPGEVELTFHNMFVTPADIDGWLTQDGADYRFPVAQHTASASPAARPEAATAHAAPRVPDSASAPAAGLPGAVAVLVPLQRQRYQEGEILRALRELGHDPAALPERLPGKSGAKAAAWRRLSWKTEQRGVFDKAWDRLRGAGEIGGG